MRGMASVAATAVVAALLVSCGYDDTPLPKDEAESPAAPPAQSTCEPQASDVYSYTASDEVVPGGKVAEILERERLIVGVSADTYLMGFANPLDDNKIQGFDIEFAKAIGNALFEDPTTPGHEFKVGENLQFKVITAADRITKLQDGDVDLVIRNMTVNCSRWEQIAFSQIYYEASQKVLVSSALVDGDEDNGEYHGLEDLAGLRVCAPKGSTSLDFIQDEEPDAIIEPAVNHTGCLVKFQQGDVDAITGDDTVLAGLAAQDPYAVIPPPCDDPDVEDGAACQEPLTTEPYGIAANQDDVDLVKYVNAVLDDMEGGAWQRAYREWLAKPLNADALQPEPDGFRPDPS
jgi:polar amino acid transport system substrate-binding protein